MALSYTRWIIGVTSSFIIIFRVIFELFIIYESRKTNGKLLSYLGLWIIFSGLTNLAATIDFLTIILTGKNLDNTHGIYGILSSVWVAPICLIAFYIGSELIKPEKKWYTKNKKKEI